MIPIHIDRVGGLGNTMFQYMFARRLQSLVPEIVIGDVRIPEFGIDFGPIGAPEFELDLPPVHQVDMQEIAHLLVSGVYDGVRLRAFVQRLEYYSDRAEMAKLFPRVCEVDESLVGAGSLVINVRGKEILRDAHEDYGPVPVDFFTQIAESSGLEPVIVGQLGDDAYSEAIRRRFAGCSVLESVSPASDFELLRSAHNVVIGVSTFSWLATWLSPHVQQIFLPVSGIFNPAQRPDIDLLPLQDERYRYFEFPHEPWTASPEQLAALVQPGKTYRLMTNDGIRRRRREAHAELAQQRQGMDASQLAAAVRKHNRLRRRLERVVQERDALRSEQPG